MDVILAAADAAFCNVLPDVEARNPGWATSSEKGMGMRVRTLHQSLAMTAVVALVTISSASPAAAQAAGQSSAFGIRATGLVNFGPTPVANSNGPTDPAPVVGTSVNAGVPGLAVVAAAAVLDAEAHRDATTGNLDATATATGVRLGTLAVNFLSAAAITARCTSTAQGITGSTTLVNAASDLTALANLSATPAPNTTIDVLGVGRFIFNEQIVDPNTGALTVNAVHLRVDAIGPVDIFTEDIIISSVTCGPFVAPTQSPTPSPSQSQSPSQSPSPSNGAGGGTLPVTGGNGGLLAAGGATLLVIGLALVYTMRTRIRNFQA